MKVYNYIHKKINLNLKVTAWVVLIIALIVVWPSLGYVWEFLTSSPEEDQARSLESSLQTAVEIYIAQQRTIPTKFSDFATIKGAAINGKTFTFEYIRRFSTITPITSDKFAASFRCGQTVTYYLKDGNVTASYSGFDSHLILKCNQ